MIKIYSKYDVKLWILYEIPYTLKATNKSFLSKIITIINRILHITKANRIVKFIVVVSIHVNIIILHVRMNQMDIVAFMEDITHAVTQLFKHNHLNFCNYVELELMHLQIAYYTFEQNL